MVHYNTIMEGIWTGRQLEDAFKIMICCCGNSVELDRWTSFVFSHCGVDWLQTLVLQCC